MARAQRDINTMNVGGGVSYGDFQDVRDIVLATNTDMAYIKAAIGRLEQFDAYARREWEAREAQALARIDAVERTLDIHQGNTEGLLRSSAVVSGVLTMIGMFLAIYISLGVR